jgi:hypothetical protein
VLQPAGVGDQDVQRAGPIHQGFQEGRVCQVAGDRFHAGKGGFVAPRRQDGRSGL